jgi:hypothetical protein
MRNLVDNLVLPRRAYYGRAAQGAGTATVASLPDQTLKPNRQIRGLNDDRA